MTILSEKVKTWRRVTKEKIVICMGGKCQICGYDKCHEALELHHIDPNQKEFSLSQVRANPKNWKDISNELRKCILLCSNCHKEVHRGITTIPKEYHKFTDIYYNKLIEDCYDICPICKTNKKLKSNITCSYKCAARKSRKVDWDNIDLLALKSEGKSNVEIASMLGVSDATVGKRLKKIKQE